MNITHIPTPEPIPLQEKPITQVNNYLLVKKIGSGSISNQFPQELISTPPFEIFDEDDYYDQIMGETEFGSIEEAAHIITHDQLALLLKGTCTESMPFKRFVIIDTRFIYEFKGGHIMCANHVQKRSDIIRLYDKYKQWGQNIAVIIHCEYSTDRGPKVLSIFSEYDRSQNLRNYPNVSFPNIFLLKGGYRTFWENHPDLCEGGYVKMKQEKYIYNKEFQRCFSYFKLYMLQENVSNRKLLTDFQFIKDDIHVDTLC